MKDTELGKIRNSPSQWLRSSQGQARGPAHDGSHRERLAGAPGRRRRVRSARRKARKGGCSEQTLWAIHGGRWSNDDCTHVPSFRHDRQGGLTWARGPMSVEATAIRGTCFSSVKGHACEVDTCGAVAQDGARPRIPLLSSSVKVGAYGPGRVQDQRHYCHLGSYAPDRGPDGRLSTGENAGQLAIRHSSAQQRTEMNILTPS